jgi:hypothetical protein
MMNCGKDKRFLLWLYHLIQALAASMILPVSLYILNLLESVVLLGLVISSSQDLYLYINIKTNGKYKQLISIPERERRQFVP